MASQTYRRGEVSALGEVIYREKIRSRVEPHERGKFVVIDVETGDYELDANDATATKRLQKRRPEAVIYGLRVGYRAAYSFGGRGLTLRND